MKGKLETFQKSLVPWSVRNLPTPDAYTSRRMDGKRALLVDLDSPKFTLLRSDMWPLPETLFGGLLRVYLNKLGVMSRSSIALRCWQVPSSREGHYHLYVDCGLTSYQELLVHFLMAAAGVQGWKNFRFLVYRGYATLFTPGSKKALGKSSS